MVSRAVREDVERMIAKELRRQQRGLRRCAPVVGQAMRLAKEYEADVLEILELRALLIEQELRRREGANV